MTTTNGADGPPYDIDYSVALLQQIKGLRDRAKAAGKAKDFREALAAVYSQLRNNPRRLAIPFSTTPTAHSRSIAAAGRR